MDPQITTNFKSLIPESWVKQSVEATRRREKLIRNLTHSGRIPDEGMDDDTVEWFVRELALMDSNNFLGNVGAGEREGRVFSNIVRRRNFSLAHGIGRSGDVVANQPKAAGSSLICRLTESMTLDVLREVIGLRSLQRVLVLPVATGMALTLTLCGLRGEQPRTKTKVVWCRIDQKTCLKSIISAGLEPIIVETIVTGDAIRCRPEDVRRALDDNLEKVLAVITTTSCFAPRVPDDVEAISAICKEMGVAHVVNNAYGLSCSKVSHRIESAMRGGGRLDAVISSTDKNFMVPVGGSIVYGPDARVLNSVSQAYPGRAAMSPVLDLFVTLLGMGRRGYAELRKARLELARGEFVAMLRRVVEAHPGLRFLDSSAENTISFAVGLTDLRSEGGDDRSDNNEKERLVTQFGSMLFVRGVSGSRVVARGHRERVGGVEFAGYGSSHSDYPTSYFTVACAIGMTSEDVRVLEQRLNSTLKDYLFA